ncbi:MAG: DNA topology modulation protein [Armatimonadetes bacterium]|nr:DNA topology modulation protein [Armatimonadota bacterium]
MHRVLIIGSAGAGKSTLARHLGERWGLPVVHLDALYWRPGWVETPPDEFDPIIQDALRKDVWIMDGNYSRTLAMRLAAADTVIYLDLPRRLCLWRVLKRGIQYRGRTRPDMGQGCREKPADGEFLRWIWNYPIRSRPKVLQMLEEQGQGKTIVRLTSPAQVRQFLRSLDGR